MKSSITCFLPTHYFQWCLSSAGIPLADYAGTLKVIVNNEKSPTAEIQAICHKHL